MFQTALFQTKSSWVAPDCLPELDGPIAIDCETRDPRLLTHGPGWVFKGENRGYIVGVGVAANGYRGYFPVRHAAGGNLDPGIVFRWLADQCKKPGPKIFHNALYDVPWLATEGIHIKPDEIHDTQFLAALLDEHRSSYSLDSCLRDYVGQAKDETLLRQAAAEARVDPKSGLWMLHASYVGPYGEQDASGTLDLFRDFSFKADVQELTQVYDLERGLIPLLIEMRRRGVKVDMEKAEKARKFLRQKELEQLKIINELSGLRVREGVPSADAAVILNHLKMPPPKTATGSESVTAGWLERQSHPVAVAMIKARKYRKAWNDFVDKGIFNMACDSRVHPSLHPLRSDDGGTVSGRFSCTGPNLQQIPARDPEIGPAIRSLYIPEEGEQWLSADYSSQEPRWTIHFAASINAPGALQTLRRFQENPRTDMHNMTAELCEIKRTPAKTIFLGLVYGMGGAKMCDQLGLPTEIWNPPNGNGPVRVAGAAGKELIEKFNKNVPWLKTLQQEAMGRAKSRGWVKTYLGRRCRLNGEDHKSLNRIIQGSSADQAKLAVATVFKKLGKLPMLLVHDENCYSVSSESEAKEITHIMETCVEGVAIPFIVDPKIANSWGECEK